MILRQTQTNRTRSSLAVLVLAAFACSPPSQPAPIPAPLPLPFTVVYEAPDGKTLARPVPSPDGRAVVVVEATAWPWGHTSQAPESRSWGSDMELVIVRAPWEAPTIERTPFSESPRGSRRPMSRVFGCWLDTGLAATVLRTATSTVYIPTGQSYEVHEVPGGATGMACSAATGSVAIVRGGDRAGISIVGKTNAETELEPRRYPSCVRWSADGSQLAVQSMGPPRSNDPRLDIYSAKDLSHVAAVPDAVLCPAAVHDGWLVVTQSGEDQSRKLLRVAAGGATREMALPKPGRLWRIDGDGDERAVVELMDYVEATESINSIELCLVPAEGETQVKCEDWGWLVQEWRLSSSPASTPLLSVIARPQGSSSRQVLAVASSDL